MGKTGCHRPQRSVSTRASREEDGTALQKFEPNNWPFLRVYSLGTLAMKLFNRKIPVGSEHC